MKKEYIKIINGEVLRTSSDDTNSKRIDNILADGFVELNIVESSIDTMEEYYSLHPIYDVGEDSAILRWESKLDNGKVKKKILEITQELESSDYKVIKNHEYIAAGLEPYYNATELYNEREAIRVQIRELETLIKM